MEKIMYAKVYFKVLSFGLIFQVFYWNGNRSWYLSHVISIIIVIFVKSVLVYYVTFSLCNGLFRFMHSLFLFGAQKLLANGCRTPEENSHSSFAQLNPNVLLQSHAK